MLPRLAFLHTAQCVRDHAVQSVMTVSDGGSAEGLGAGGTRNAIRTTADRTGRAAVNATADDVAALQAVCQQSRQSQVDPNLEGTIFLGGWSDVSGSTPGGR
jgi:hypothetical protein